MFPLLRLITLRHLREEKTRTLLTLTGIALGVALFVSVRLANESILHAFRGTVEAVAGRTTLQIRGGDAGVDESLFPKLRDVPGVRAVTPVLQTIAVIEGIDEPLLVMGVDPFSEYQFRDYFFSQDESSHQDLLESLLDPQSLFISEKFAKVHGFSTGSTIRLLVDDQAHEFVIRGLLKFEGVARAMEGNFAFMDIATYQWRFDRIGRLDRIDVMTRQETPVEELIQQLSAQLPEGVEVNRPSQRGVKVERMVGAFQLNLTALSAIALLVALFLMYNTMAMAIVRRRTEIGILRCLGTSGPALLALFLLEAFFLGLLGSLAGVLGGWALAQWALKAMEQTVTALYTPVIVQNVTLSPSILSEGLALGCLVSLSAGIISVREAVRVIPREVLHRGSHESSIATGYGKTAFLGLFLLGMAFAFAMDHPAGLPFFGYASALSLLLGFSCLVPMTTVLLHHLIHRLPLTWTPTELKLASHSLVSALGRSSMAGVAILIGLAMMGGMMIMIKSFRATVQVWIDQTISADLFIIPAAREVSGLEAKMPREVLDKLKSLPMTLAVDPILIHRATLRGEEITISARDFSVLRDHSTLLVIGGHAGEAIQQGLEQEAVLVSEPLAYRLAIREGHQIQLPTPKGPANLTVAGVFYDYTTDGGRVLMDGGLFRKYWPEDKITTLAVYLVPQTDLETARRAILRQLAKDHRILITSNRELRDRILKIFDQTFAITYALEIIAVLVAILGVMNTLLTAILERKRELAIVRVLGATQAQMQKIILHEAFLICLTGISLGLAASILLSQILIHVINKQSYGWTIFLHPSWIGLSQAALLVLLASLLSAYLPAKQASGIRLTEALQYE